MSETVLYQKDRGFVKIILNRPDKLNAFNEQMFRELANALDQAAEDPEIKAVIWTGSGDRAFSSGFDISGEAGREGGSPVDRTPEEALESMERSCRYAMRLWDFPKPIVAAVSGYCLAIAHELVQVCDIVIAADTARFGEPEIRHHSCPPVFITPYIVGFHKAKELLLTGTLVDAHEAKALGLVNRVVPAEGLMEEAERFAKRLALVPALSLRLNKRAINNIWEQMGLRESLAYGAAMGGIVHTTDVPEWERFRKIQAEQGFRAFLEARDGPHRELEGGGDG